MCRGDRPQLAECQLLEQGGALEARGTAVGTVRKLLGVVDRERERALHAHEGTGVGPGTGFLVALLAGSDRRQWSEQWYRFTPFWRGKSCAFPANSALIPP